MNTLKNRVRLVGNLGANLKVKSFDQNKKMAKLGIKRYVTEIVVNEILMPRRDELRIS